MGIPYTKFPDGNFFRAGARGFCLSFHSNKNIAPPFASQSRTQQWVRCQAKNIPRKAENF